MIIHCVSIRAFLKLFGAKTNNKDSDYVNRLISAACSEYTTDSLLIAHSSQYASSQPGLFRKHYKTPNGARRRRGCCSSHSLTRLQALPADSPTHRLKEGRAQAESLAAGGVIKWERWLAEDWCVTLSRDATTMLHCQSGNYSAFTIHTPCAEGLREAGCYWCETHREKGEFITHTLNSKQWQWANMIFSYS